MQANWASWISLSSLIFGSTVIVVRMIWFRSTIVDRAMNLCLTTSALLAASRHPIIEHLATIGHLPPTTVTQLAAPAYALTCGTEIIVAMNAKGTAFPPAAAYGLAAVSGSVALGFGTPAREHHVMLDRQGWWELGYWLSAAPIALLVCWALGSVSISRLRETLPAPERRFYTWVLIGTVAQTAYLFSAALAAAGHAMAGHYAGSVRVLDLTNRSAPYFLTMLAAILMSIPLAGLLIERAGLDRWSRHRKRLLPLWQDLTDTCPHVVYTPPGLPEHSMLLLHRTIIEIRDCILILTHYITPNPPEIDAAIEVSGHNTQALRRAVQLARALTTKAERTPVSDRIPGAPSPCADIEDEVRDLTALATEWNYARQLAAKSVARQAVARIGPVGEQ
ncbi:DUF6545 domain-containing protein [Nocardia sp. NBC_00511]|uniref:DUF6545 domain-containing protein n=1 Tax=Nocardia sp. NBC_00511 TaxID=2903591 RepID=UPI0030E213FB